MILLNDIYFKLDSGIVSQDFWELGIDEKKNLIDRELKNYLHDKIYEITHMPANKDLTVSDLLSILAEHISDKDHADTISHFTHYILKVIGTLQNWAITWWVEEDEELIEFPLIDFDANGMWSNLITHKDTNYIKTFNFVYETWNNNFMTKNHPKKLVKKSKQRNKKYEFTAEQLAYIDANWGKESAHSMKLKFGCSWIAVVKAAQKMGHEAPKSNAWPDEDIIQLKELAEKYHYTTIAKIMNRSENAIYIKARRLNITLFGRRAWTEAEEKQLSKEWGTVSIESLAKKMKRSVFSLRVKAIRLKLGAMILNDYEKIIISDIVDVLNVSRDRIYTTWKKLGLNIKTTRVSKNRTYKYVTLEDLWDFLEKNQSQWDSRELEPLSLGVEPDWLPTKREKDRNAPPREYKVWTNEELGKATDLLLLGKDYDYIALVISRTPNAVAEKLREIVGGFKLARYWKGKELLYLKNNFENMSYEEIGNELNRTVKAIGAKTAELGYSKRKKKSE